MGAEPLNAPNLSGPISARVGIRIVLQQLCEINTDEETKRLQTQLALEREQLRTAQCRQDLTAHDRKHTLAAEQWTVVGKHSRVRVITLKGNPSHLYKLPVETPAEKPGASLSVLLGEGATVVPQAAAGWLPTTAQGLSARVSAIRGTLQEMYGNLSSEGATTVPATDAKVAGPLFQSADAAQGLSTHVGAAGTLRAVVKNTSTDNIILTKKNDANEVSKEEVEEGMHACVHCSPICTCHSNEWICYIILCCSVFVSDCFALFL